MKQIATLLLLGTTLAACNTTGTPPLAAGPQLSDAELFGKARIAVAASLKDPDSAKFIEMHRVPSSQGDYVCGRVNAKNSFGAYAGADKFSVAPNGDAVLAGEPVRFSDAAHIWTSPCWGAL